MSSVLTYSLKSTRLEDTAPTGKRRLMHDEVLKTKVAYFLLLSVALMAARHLAESRREAACVAAGISIERMMAGEGR